MSQAMKPPTLLPPASAPEVDDDDGCCEHGAAAVFKLRRAARAYQALPPRCACETWASCQKLNQYWAACAMETWESESHVRYVTICTHGGLLLPRATEL